VTFSLLNGVHHIPVDLPVNIEMRELVIVIISVKMQQLILIDGLTVHDELIVSIVHRYRIGVTRIQHEARLGWVENWGRLLH
jgi:hypothetical protein